MDNNGTEIGTASGAVPSCSVCGVALVRKERVLTSIHTRLRYTEPDSLEYQTVVVCPKRIGLSALFYFRHDYRLYADDGSEVTLTEDEFTMAV